MRLGGEESHVLNMYVVISESESRVEIGDEIRIETVSRPFLERDILDIIG